MSIFFIKVFVLLLWDDLSAVDHRLRNHGSGRIGQIWGKLWANQYFSVHHIVFLVKLVPCRCRSQPYPTKSNSNCKYTDLVFRIILTDFDSFVTVFSSARTRTFLLFLFLSKWNAKLFDCREKKIENLDWHIFVPNLILYKVMPVKIRNNFAQKTGTNLKNPHRGMSYIGDVQWIHCIPV